MSDNKKATEKKSEKIFVVKMHKLLGSPHILGFKDPQEVAKLQKLQGARYDFFKVPVEKL